jgi:hypothetical protein
MHRSCVKISTISKRTKMTLHLCLVTSEYHQVHKKRLLSLWYVCHKPCTYIAPTLTPSPNGQKQDSPWPTSPRSFIGCVQNDFLSLWYVRHKLCTYLASRLALSPNIQKQASTWASSPRSTIECVQNDYWAYGTFGANRAPILSQD